MQNSASKSNSAVMIPQESLNDGAVNIGQKCDQFMRMMSKVADPHQFAV